MRRFVAFHAWFRVIVRVLGSGSRSATGEEQGGTLVQVSLQIRLPGHKRGDVLRIGVRLRFVRASRSCTLAMKHALG